MNKLKRYVIFLIGLFVNSLGVSLITKASLGTSPISSIPYVLSLSFPFTLGNFTIFFILYLYFLEKLNINFSIICRYFERFFLILLFELKQPLHLERRQFFLHLHSFLEKLFRIYHCRIILKQFYILQETNLQDDNFFRLQA